jgi:excisionase family DNA binding protein
MSTALDETIRAIVREVVRDEVRAALADAQHDRRNRAFAGDEYLPIARAASIAAVAPGTIRAWIRAGRLEARRAGRVYRIARSELDAFLARSAAERGDVDVRAIARTLAA